MPVVRRLRYKTVYTPRRLVEFSVVIEEVMAKIA